MWYAWHPWCGRKVKVHATLVKRGIAVARCSSGEVFPDRSLELPLWMLDRAVCCKIHVAKPGSVRVESLRQLRHLLNVVQSASARLANDSEHQYLLNAGGADINVAASQAPRPTSAAGVPSLESTDESIVAGSVDGYSAEDGAVARATPTAALRRVPRREGSRGGER